MENIKENKEKEMVRKTEQRGEEIIINPDSTIGEIVFKYPEVIEPLGEYGIHCIGCGAAAFESISQGLMAHGYTEEEVSKIIEEITRIVKEKRKNLLVK